MKEKQKRSIKIFASFSGDLGSKDFYRNKIYNAKELIEGEIFYNF